jgi:hypothetical protein
MNRHGRTLLGLFALLWLVSSKNLLKAQQGGIPETTDITSVTSVSSPDSARFVQFLKRGCQDSAYFVRQVHGLKGTISYRKDLRSYVVSYGVPNTIDSYWTGIICNWPQVDKWLNKPVTFSGRYYQARGVKQKYGGETVLYLHVTSMR